MLSDKIQTAVKNLCEALEEYPFEVRVELFRYFDGKHYSAKINVSDIMIHPDPKGVGHD
jgi:hypothetical protein